MTEWTDRSFSNDKPVDSIETEKSRIVVHELEQGWWILAVGFVCVWRWNGSNVSQSIDLTRLPSLAHTSSDAVMKTGDKSDTKPAMEYSAREVSPPALLIQQLLQAHYVFCLHHGPSLTELYVRLTRDRFCNTLDRYWARFSRNWDVLLHGSPATDVFSGLKLASGGELGFGVGEEEWGSGEREVLEDLTRRTEGLVDVVVARFGEPAPAEEDKDALPWMGSGSQPIASDGIIFGGAGALERHSLRDVSLWMRQIYTYGEQAYGVRDNPLRERRKRRRRNPPEQGKNSHGDIERSKSSVPRVDQTDLPQVAEHGSAAEHDKSAEESTPATQPDGTWPETKSRVTSQDHATTPEATPTRPSDEDKPDTPPPIVTAAEQSLQNATRQADQSAVLQTEEQVQADEYGTTLGIPDQYMKYLTFGLSTLGRSSPNPTSSAAHKPPTTTSKTPQDQKKDSEPTTSSMPIKLVDDDDEDAPMMTRLEPMPDGDAIKAKIATQKRQQNTGHFIIGLTGGLLGLDELPEDDETDVTDSGPHDESEGSRIILRTVQVELALTDSGDQTDEDSQYKSSSLPDLDSMNESTKNVRRLRVLIYVHRPFMYCFLFENRTSALQLTKFYKTLHRNLVPIHKPLLSSTNVAKVAQRIENSHLVPSDDDAASVSSSRNKLPSKIATSSPIFDLIYDPSRLTLHTSIPNIPEPGTPAAEGIFTSSRDGGSAPSPWTRIEALNVHSQILNTLASVRNRGNEVERTSKTSRGWWIVWLKVPPADNGGQEHEDKMKEWGPSDQIQPSDDSAVNSTPAAEDLPERTQTVDLHRTAFLVRKAVDAPSATKVSTSSSRAVSSMLGVMSLGMSTSREDDHTGGMSAGWGPAALAGGIGIDARKYVEGLLSLNR